MDTLTISQLLQTSGLERKPAEAIAKLVNQRNQELATKQDLKIVVTVLVAIMSAGFGYLLNAINNNHDLLNTLINSITTLGK